MTQAVPLDSLDFTVEPRCEFQEAFRCFKDPNNNGLLFRLVQKDETKGADGQAAVEQKWWFHNDTDDTVMKVRAFFQPTDKLTVLRGCKQSTAPGVDRDGKEVELTVVDAEVVPGDTHPFVKGIVNGFELEFQADAAPEPVDSVEFVMRKPRVRYTKLYKCFRNNGNGLLFRLVDDRNNTWYFHNDTQDYNMTAVVEFSDRKDVMPEGNTKEVGVPEGYPEGVTLSITVGPGETEPFITGNPINYKMSYSADPINNDQPEDQSQIQYELRGPDNAVIDAQSADVYKCFKKNGNGLLFRIVGQDKWAYYNDTDVYVMTAIVKFPNEESYSPSAHATTSEDPEDPNVTIVSMEIPPGETRTFIEGRPNNFETRYSAEGVNQPKPEEHPPSYRHDGPVAHVMEYTQVTKVVKAHNSEDAILYRLFNPENKQWGFYNDSDDVTVTCRITFNEGSDITCLGSAVADANEPNCFTTTVEPLQTVAFVRGDYQSFESKFSGSRKVANRTPGNSQTEL